MHKNLSHSKVFQNENNWVVLLVHVFYVEQYTIEGLMASLKFFFFLLTLIYTGKLHAVF